MPINRDALVIGLTGSFGSGCSTLAKAFESRGFYSTKLSRIVRDEAARRGKSPNRHTLQEIGDNLRLAKGNEYLAKETIARTRSESKGRIRYLVIDSIRNTAEIRFLRKVFTNFYLLAVNCPIEERWARLRSDYESQGQTRLNFESEDRRDQDEEVPHGQQVQLSVDDADAVISNSVHHVTEDAAIAALRSIAEEYAKLFSGEIPREPKQDEIAMTLAYTQAKRSLCLKRWVGAVIADENGEVVSIGYNENPEPMKACYMEFSYCFKDARMAKILKAQEGMPCPRCREDLRSLTEPFRCQKCGYELKSDRFPDRGMQFCTALHAEQRALRNASGRDLTGMTLYTTTFPCFECAKHVIVAGIKTVVYGEPYPSEINEELLVKGDVAARDFEGVKARAFAKLFDFNRFGTIQQAKFRLP